MQFSLFSIFVKASTILIILTCSGCYCFFLYDSSVLWGNLKAVHDDEDSGNSSSDVWVTKRSFVWETTLELTLLSIHHLTK